MVRERWEGPVGVSVVRVYVTRSSNSPKPRSANTDGHTVERRNPGVNTKVKKGGDELVSLTTSALSLVYR